MRARRILVPLIVLALAAALYSWRGFGAQPIVDVPDDVTECAASLRQIYAGLMRQALATQHAPEHSGVAMLGALIASGALEDTPASRAHLTCPGPHATKVRADVDYRVPEALTSADSAYAGRDNAAYPLAKFPAGGGELEPMVACDNAHGLNHEGCMNVLYSDGTVRTFLLGQEIERGRLAPGARTIPVGQDSPIHDLRKLVGD